MATSRGGGHGHHSHQNHNSHRQPLSEEERISLKPRVFSVIRASLLPAAKHGLKVEMLSREYREFTGKHIPHRDLGYSTLEDLLDQNRDLCKLVQKPDGWYVYPRTSEESAHIAKMVTAQRTKARKAKPKPAPRPRFNAQQRLWSPTPGGHPGYRGGPGGGGGGYNNPQAHQQQPLQNNRGFQNNQQNSGSGRQGGGPTGHSATNRRLPGGSGRFAGGAVNGSSGDGRGAPGGGNRNQRGGGQGQQQHKALRTPHSNTSMNMYRDYPPPPPAMSHPNPHMGHHPMGQTTLPPPAHLAGPPPPHAMPPRGTGGSHSMNPTNHNNNNQSGRSNKNQQQMQNHQKINNQQQNKPKNSSSSSSSAPTSHQLASDHYRQLLAGWLRAQGCEPCAYETSPVETKSTGNSKGGGGKGGKVVKRFFSTVIVNDKRYQTFPDEFPTAEEAEEAVSKIACTKLNITASSSRGPGGSGGSASSAGHPSQASQTPPGGQGQNQAKNSRNSSLNGSAIGNAVGDKGSANSKHPSSDTDFGTWSNGMLDGASAANNSSASNLGDRVIQRIMEIVGSRTNGVWSTQIEVEYSRKFKPEVLPEKWPAALERMSEGNGGMANRLRVDRPIPGDTSRCIILPNLSSNDSSSAAILTVDTASSQAVKSPQASPAVAAGSQAPSPGSGVMPPAAAMAVPPPVPQAKLPGSQGATQQGGALPPPPPASPFGPPGMPDHSAHVGMAAHPPPLTLPSDVLWDVYVTWVNSTTNVRLRILGDNYSARFDELATNMELHYFEAEKMPPVERPLLGKLYAAKVEGDWHRVEVTHLGGSGKITCYFIDHGDEDEFSGEDLRELDPKFLDLAPQAKQVRLAHLEDWKDSSEAQAELSNMALGKSLVAQLQANDENGVSLILWDTSGDEKDVNINQQLRDKLCGIEGMPLTFEDMPPLEHFTSAAGGNKEGGSSGKASPASGGGPASSEGKGPSVDLQKEGHKAAAMVPMEAVKEADLADLFATDLGSMRPLVQTHPPNIDDFYDISVTLAASPSNFTVQSYAEEKALEEMQRDMNVFYESHPWPEGSLNSGHLAKDSYFAGKHSDNVWYRVKVNSMLDEATAAVKMVDFGDFTMIPLERMQPLWPRYRNLPMQAINASLADIVAVNGDWSPSDTVWFTQRVLRKQFVSKVKDVVTDTSDPDSLSYELSVSLFDTSDPDQDIVIDKELVDAGRAVYLCLYQSQNSSIRERERVR